MSIVPKVQTAFCAFFLAFVFVPHAQAFSLFGSGCEGFENNPKECEKFKAWKAQKESEMNGGPKSASTVARLESYEAKLKSGQELNEMEKASCITSGGNLCSLTELKIQKLQEEMRADSSIATQEPQGPGKLVKADSGLFNSPEDEAKWRAEVARRNGDTTGDSTGTSSAAGGCSAADRASGAKCIDLDQEETASNSTSSSSGCGQTGAKCVDLGSDDDGYGAGGNYVSNSTVQNTSGVFDPYGMDKAASTSNSGNTALGKGIAGAKKWADDIANETEKRKREADARPGELAGIGGGSGGGGLLGGLGGGALASLGSIPGLDKAQSLLGQANGLLNNKYVNMATKAAGINGDLKAGLGQATGALNMASGLAGQASSLAGKASSIGGSITSLASNAQSSLGNLNLSSAASSLTGGGSLSLASAKDTLKQVQAGAKTVSGLVDQGKNLASQGKNAVAGIQNLTKQTTEIVKPPPGV